MNLCGKLFVENSMDEIRDTPFLDEPNKSLWGDNGKWIKSVR
jgi:hypothetical protein